MESLRRTVGGRRMLPHQPIALYEDYPTQHPPVIDPGLATRLWKIRAQPCKLRLGQPQNITHHASNSCDPPQTKPYMLMIQPILGRLTPWSRRNTGNYYWIVQNRGHQLHGSLEICRPNRMGNHGLGQLVQLRTTSQCHRLCRAPRSRGGILCKLERRSKSCVTFEHKHLQ